MFFISRHSEPILLLLPPLAVLDLRDFRPSSFSSGREDRHQYLDRVPKNK